MAPVIMAGYNIQLYISGKMLTLKSAVLKQIPRKAAAMGYQCDYNL